MNNEERTEEIFARAEKIKKTKKRNARIAVTSIVATLVVSLQLFLFIPYSSPVRNLKKYANSEYYSLIQGIEPITRKQNRYKNNFEKFFSKFSLKSAGDAAPNSANYNETTDNQTDGVTEGDRLKRSDEYAYYLSYNGVLRIYSLDGSTQPVGELAIEQNAYLDWSSAEEFLSEDLKTLTVFVDEYSDFAKTIVYFIDVTTPQNPKITSTVKLSGSYISSRFVGNELTAVTRFAFATNFDFAQESLYIPSYESNGETFRFSSEEIIVPDAPSRRYYTVIYKFSGNDVTSKLALLSRGDDGLYASADSLYAYGSLSNDGKTITELTRVDYRENLNYVASIKIDGTVNDQYSLDEKDDVLRVVVTDSDENGLSNASLYCLDSSSLTPITELKHFAPEGESVRSVRFRDDKAYVCTSLRINSYNTDPVFVIDLSDLNAVTIKDTGTIPGYSLALKNFTDDTLLGIGYGETDYLKVELYRETETSVKSVTLFEDYSIFPATEYKSYLIDPSRGLIGVPTNPDYVLLYYDGSCLTEYARLNLGLSVAESNAVRACIVNDSIYVFTYAELRIVPLG